MATTWDPKPEPGHPPERRNSKGFNVIVGAGILAVVTAMGAYEVARPNHPPVAAAKPIEPAKPKPTATPTPSQEQASPNALNHAQISGNLQGFVGDMTLRLQTLGTSEHIAKVGPKLFSEEFRGPTLDLVTGETGSFDYVATGALDTSGNGLDPTTVQQVTLMQNDAHGKQTASYIFEFNKGEWDVRVATDVVTVHQYTTGLPEKDVASITTLATLSTLEQGANALLAVAEAGQNQPLPSQPTDPSSSPTVKQA